MEIPISVKIQQFLEESGYQLGQHYGIIERPSEADAPSLGIFKSNPDQKKFFGLITVHQRANFMGVLTIRNSKGELDPLLLNIFGEKNAEEMDHLAEKLSQVANKRVSTVLGDRLSRLEVYWSDVID